ncbi:3-oxoacyl-ACP synthase [Marinigracilibium pacificum]|uniref:3-oxoacyl-ACP synthase n=1 Tax=Marinigracilibium pacificum TaxID=2729599 RepID=A0A848IW79_9BACT|nr:3-oxoacyl-ACP synthase [Marinigracilibium pacificum]NMM47535.1 3-oxoacyl-ACP synthase [Marinigracilibium pacificum]
MTNKETELKNKIHQYCIDETTKKIALIEQGMKEAQDSANNETKSSAGDKYETGRAMAQLEKDKFSAQLAENRKILQVLNSINLNKNHSIVESGALVFTTSGNYYISVSLGKIVIDNTDFFAISPITPLANALLNLKKDDIFVFRNKEFKIKNIL